MDIWEVKLQDAYTDARLEDFRKIAETIYIE